MYVFVLHYRYTYRYSWVFRNCLNKICSVRQDLLSWFISNFQKEKMLNSSSIYDDALAQLHLNYQTLQETMLNLGREQSKILESVNRIQNDLECYKDSQNDRLDEILTNIDSDIRKVSQDAQKCSAQSDSKLAEFIRDSAVDTLRTDLREIRNELAESRKHQNDNDSSAIAELSAKIEISQKDLTSFKTETAEKLQKAVIEGGKISSSIENSCMAKLEHYIGTEIVDEIVGTINNKLCHMKSDIQNELELQKIQIEETCVKVGKLKNKVSDLENPKKSFDLSDLMASSMDVTRTPFQGKFFRTPTRPSSPILETEVEYTEYVEEVSSTPRLAEDHKQTGLVGYDPVEVNNADVTLYEDIVLREDKREEEKPETETTTDHSSQTSYCPPCSGEDQTTVEDFGEKITTFPSTKEDMEDIYMEIPAKAKRRESFMSSLFINVASFLDV